MQERGKGRQGNAKKLASSKIVKRWLLWAMRLSPTGDLWVMISPLTYTTQSWDLFSNCLSLVEGWPWGHQLSPALWSAPCRTKRAKESPLKESKKHSGSHQCHRYRKANDVNQVLGQLQSWGRANRAFLEAAKHVCVFKWWWTMEGTCVLAESTHSGNLLYKTLSE